ncbi:Lysine-specific demethylase 8 [Hondaea fermentalgiana]|uniref:Lysine-specific demethylase 8 n=1 Tax=Hondaea fermentalgiana TaxID=2315210 RepID=A0A2R5GJJ9_9STRA|nr:Lysine-specific demethylase 8 [Hondaea fermentalgiana]|eukprot:GBG30499.1 Lysine-specific demethylase 8 [Hondaea fermentalgiana]
MMMQSGKADGMETTARGAAAGRTATLGRLRSALGEEAAYHWAPPGGRVPVERGLDAVRFLREYVAQNRPVIIDGLVDEWPAAQRWDPAYLCGAAGSQKLHVNVTPGGHGDCVRDGVFVKPAEVEMTMQEFFDKLGQGTNRDLGADQDGEGVPYLSHQNDNLRQELPFLEADLPDGFALAQAAFGPLEACNLWIGDERAVSSMHLDHFENFYAVIEGEKVFHLLPPCFHPALFLGEASFPAATWQRDDHGAWAAVRDDPAASVPWIPYDPVTQPEQFSPQVTEALVECHVQRGQILYLPAMWLHRASQTRLTVAVNYWFDMAFDLRWVYHNALGAACETDALNDDDDDEKASTKDNDSAHDE